MCPIIIINLIGSTEWWRHTVTGSVVFFIRQSFITHKAIFSKNMWPDACWCHAHTCLILTSVCVSILRWNGWCTGSCLHYLRQQRRSQICFSLGQSIVKNVFRLFQIFVIMLYTFDFSIFFMCSCVFTILIPINDY